MNKRNGLLVLIIFVSVVAGLVLGNFTARRSMNVQGFLSGGKFGKSTIDELLYRIDNDYVDTMNIDSLTQQTMRKWIQNKVGMYFIPVLQSGVFRINFTVF